MTGSEFVVRSGQVVAPRLFDFANEIDLKRAETLWVRRPEGASIRSRLVRTPAEAVAFGVAPLTPELGTVALDIAPRASMRQPASGSMIWASPRCYCASRCRAVV